jgi:hypothetical protein
MRCSRRWAAVSTFPTTRFRIAATGVESATPLALAVQPMLNPRKGAPLALVAGRYRLCLIFADPTATVDMVRDADGAGRVLVKDFEVTLSSPTTIRVTLTPRTGAAILSALTLTPQP